MNGNSCYSTSSPAFDVVGVLDLGHFDRCAVGSHCYFYLHNLLCLFANFICIFLITYELEYHSICFFTVCISSLVRLNGEILNAYTVMLLLTALA